MKLSNYEAYDLTNNFVHNWIKKYSELRKYFENNILTDMNLKNEKKINNFKITKNDTTAKVV